MTIRLLAGASSASGGRSLTPKRKRTNFRWPSIGKNSPANRPDPDGPGGLGAEESGTERTGSTQDLLVASQRGGRWADRGQEYDSSNVPGSRHFLLDRSALSVGSGY